MMLLKNGVAGYLAARMNGTNEMRIDIMDYRRQMIMTDKKDEPKKQDWVNGVLSRLQDGFKAPETKTVKVVRILCALCLVALMVVYHYAIK